MIVDTKIMKADVASLLEWKAATIAALRQLSTSKNTGQQMRNRFVENFRKKQNFTESELDCNRHGRLGRARITAAQLRMHTIP